MAEQVKSKKWLDGGIGENLKIGQMAEKVKI